MTRCVTCLSWNRTIPSRRRAVQSDALSGSATASSAPAPPRCALVRRASDAGGLLVHDDDDAAVEPAALAAQRRVAAGPPRQLAGRRGRALLLQLEGAEEGRPAADEPARALAVPARSRHATATAQHDARSSMRRRRSSLSSRIRCAVKGCGRAPGRSSAGARRSSSRSSGRRSTTRGSSRTSRGSTTRGRSVAFYPGRYEPPNAPVRGPMSVPYDQRWRLLATFNGGFIYSDGHNGSSIGGKEYEPLKDGLATLVAYRDGRVDVKTWTGGPVAGPQIAFARQSLPLIVDHGRLNPALERQLAVGLHARQRGPRVAHRRRDRPARQPDLRRGGLSDGDHARADPAARGRGSRDAARHQPRVADADHLHAPRRPRLRSRWCPTTSSRRRATSSRTTATSSPSTGACRARSPCRSSDDAAPCLTGAPPPEYLEDAGGADRQQADDDDVQVAGGEQSSTTIRMPKNVSASTGVGTAPIRARRHRGSGVRPVLEAVAAPRAELAVGAGRAVERERRRLVELGIIDPVRPPANPERTTRDPTFAALDDVECPLPLTTVDPHPASHLLHRGGRRPMRSAELDPTSVVPRTRDASLP